MSKALALAVTLVFTRVASAQPGATPAGAPEQPPPAPAPAPPTPVPEQPPSAPPADPAYGGRPDTTVTNADSGDIPGLRRGNQIVVRYTPDRSKQNITLLAALGGTSVIAGAIGLYFHFDSRSSADEVSADRFTGHAWTPDRQKIYDDGHSSRNVAIAAYSVGAALLLGTAIVYMVTEPDVVETVITPKPQPRAAALVAPTRGGAMVGGTWSF